jgi:hypothetical protein
MTLLVLLNTSILIILSFLHIYWALGGNWGMNAVLPTVSEGQRRFLTGIYGRFAIGAAIGAFAFVSIGTTGIFDVFAGRDFFRYASTAIALLFLLRAIGDFRYIGFFKKANGTLFAKNDTRFYSPLCIFIAALFLVSAWIN